MNNHSSLSGDVLQSCHEALRRGRWLDARACFEQALKQHESAEAWEGLSWALWWLGDADTMFAARERAYSLYRDANDLCGAARMAIWLASDHLDIRGEVVIASGWRQRAHRLLEGIDPTPEHGWLAIHCGAIAIEIEHHPTTALAHAREATRIGRAIGNRDLELLGLAMEGLALVSQGYIDEGMKCLDEAGAAASAGEVEEKFSVAWMFCYLIYACERARDFDRAGQWCQRLKEFSERVGFRFTLGVCRAHYAGVLISRGKWSEAESELSSATADLEASRPAQVAESLVRLAELRRRQGNLEEADRLFRRMEFHPITLLGRAELALDRNEPQLATELTEQYLRHIPADNRLQRVPALEILVRASVQLGKHDQAAEHLTTLEAIVLTVPTDPMRGSLAFAEAMYLHATGDDERARQRLEDAMMHYERCKAPFESARARRELAEVFLALGRNESAQEAATRALEVFDEIGALYEAGRTSALLNTIQPPKQKKIHIRGAVDSLTQREVEILRLVADGLSDKQIAARLHLSEHTVHRHISNILTKLNVHSRAAAVARASSAGAL